MTKVDERLENKAKAQALLLEGKTVTEVVKLTGVAKSAVARYGQELRKAREDEAVTAVSNLDPQVVIALAERLEQTSPVLARNLVHLSEGLESMNKLEPVLHNAVGDLIVMTQERMNDKKLKTSEFKMLGELLLKSYATLYNRPQVDINISQNNLVQTAGKEYVESLTRGLFNNDQNTIEMEK